MKDFNINWKQIDREALEIDTNHIASGQADGRINKPSSEQTRRSASEGEIVDKCHGPINNQIDLAKPILQNKENNLVEVKQKIYSDSFHALEPQLKTDLNSIASHFKQVLIEQYHEWNKCKKEYQSFQAVNKLKRPHSKKSIGMTTFGILLIVGLLFFEIDYNTKMLSEALVGGQNAGAAMAWGVAWINVFLSFLIGAGVMRNLNHIKKSTRIISGLVLSAYVLLFTFVNFALGIFRTAASKSILESAVTREMPTITEMGTWGSLAVRPWSNIDILDVTGWTLVIMGMSFAIIALFDGYLFADTYPGYGKVGKNLDIAEKKYLSLATKYRKDGKTNFELTVKAAADCLGQDSNNRELLDQEYNSFQAIFLDYEDMVNNWERDIDHIVQEYRDANSEKRTTPEPKYFSEPFKLSNDIKFASKKFPAQYEHFATDEQRTSMMNKLRELNESQYAQALIVINSTYDEYNKKIEEVINDYTIY